MQDRIEELEKQVASLTHQLGTVNKIMEDNKLSIAVNRYTFRVSVLETNTYSLVVYATNEEQARELAKENGIGTGSSIIVDGAKVGLEENCYEFEEWGMGGEPDDAKVGELWDLELRQVIDNDPMPEK